MEKRLKIAFFNFTQNLIVRGAEVFVKELSKRLNTKYKVTILSENRKLFKRLPILWRLYLDPQGIQIFLFTIKNLRKVFKEKYDVVIPLNGGWQAVLLRFATWVYGGKMIISGQSGKGWDDKNNILIFPDYFVPISTDALNWAKKINPFIKFKYIPNGVDLNKFKANGEKINFGLQKPIILCVGALTNEKRIHLTISAVSKLSIGSLVVLGSGPLEKKVTDVGRKLLGDRFLLTKGVQSELPKYYRGADFFTLASPSYRSFEIVIVEAMACNLPVVVNDDPIRREIVGDAGVFVNPEKVDDYIKGLKKALSLKWGNKPRKQAEKFSWDFIVKEYEKLFKELKSES